MIGRAEEISLRINDGQRGICDRITKCTSSDRAWFVGTSLHFVARRQHDNLIRLEGFLVQENLTKIRARLLSDDSS